MNLNSLIQKFLLQEIQEQIKLFPPALDYIYAHVVDSLRQKYPGLDSSNFSLNDPSEEGAVYQLFKYFPSHFFKAYHSLTVFEDEINKFQNITKFLHWPGITLVDVGCGAGAVSLALLALVERFQQFLSKNNKPLSPVKVLLIGIDVNSHMLGLYQDLIHRYAKTLSQWLIEVVVETRQISFPSKDISRLIHTVQPVHRHFVLLVMSNLIRVQDEMFGNKETVFREIIAQVLQDEPERDPEFGMADTRYIRELIWPYASYIYTQVNKMSLNYQ